jgi:hypothetical protein
MDRRSEEADEFSKWKEAKKIDRAYRNAKEWDKRGVPLSLKKKVKVKKRYGKRKKKRRNQEEPKVLFVHSRRREFDFMKYTMLVEYWAMSQFDLSREDLGMLFFLYSEDFFTKELFIEFADAMLGKRNALNSYIEKGFIEEIDRKDSKTGADMNIPKIYRLSYSCKRMINAIYDKILLRTQISESNKKTKIFRPTKASFRDKKYAGIIKKMNESGKRIREGKDLTYLKDDSINL